MPRLRLLLALAVFSGCFLDEMRMRNVPEGGTPSWRFGYADGCQSGKSDAGSVKKLDKDLARFRSDDDYRDGWQRGYRECYEREMSGLAEMRAGTPPVDTAVTGAAPAPTPSTSPAGRRAEIEKRLDSLRKEMRSLEEELETLPKAP